MALVEESDRFDAFIDQPLSDAGEAKIEFDKGSPMVTMRKWEREVNFGLMYPRTGVAVKQIDDKLVYAGADFDLRTYELPKGPQRDGGLEFEIVLHSRPVGVNSWTFEMQGHKDLNFYFQPPMTGRPTNVVNSYAVYHKTKRNHSKGVRNYATGKAFHIFRPEAIDALGSREWGSLDIDPVLGTLTVSIRSAWLDAAVYPVIIDPELGFNTEGASSANTESDTGGSRHTAVEDGTGVSMTVYTAIGDASAAHDWECGFYTDADDTLVTNSVTPSGAGADPGPGFTTFTYSGSFPSISNGVTYIICAYQYSGAGNDVLRFDTGGAAAGMRHNSAQFPDPITPVDNTWEASVYLTYTAAGAAGNPWYHNAQQ